MLCTSRSNLVGEAGRMHELYPRSRNDLAYVTATAWRNIEHVKRLCETEIRRKDIYNAIGANASIMSRILSGQSCPTLNTYLGMCNYCGIDLSHDVNYAYAAVLYSPADLMRRLQRITPKEYRERGIPCRYIAIGTGLSRESILEAVNYWARRSLTNYAIILYFLAGKERGYCFKDRIILDD